MSKEPIRDQGGKLVCVEVTRPETHPGLFCMWKIKNFSAADEMDGAEEGESIVLTLRLLTDEQFTDLGDFDGW